MVTPRNYAKLCNATLLTSQLITAGITMTPTPGFKMFGVSVDATPNTTVWVIDTLTAPDGVIIDNVVAAHVATPQASGDVFAEFRADGSYRQFVGGTIDIQEADAPFTIGFVLMRRETAGLSGQTMIDIWKNGVSLWNVNPGNRPVITAASGNQVRIVATLPDVVSINMGDRLEMAIIQVETGSPQDILLTLLG